MPDTQPTHEEIAALAYKYWQERGEEKDSVEADWFKAEQDLNDTDSLH